MLRSLIAIFPIILSGAEIISFPSGDLTLRGVLYKPEMLRLLIEDVTLLKADKITAHVLLRGGGTRTLTIERPVPMAQIRKPKPAVIAEVDRLLNEHCDRRWLRS